MAEGKQLSSWRWRSPFIQCCYCSCITAATAGLYKALNGLGSGGGKPTSQTVAAQTNCIEDSIWTVVCLFGSVLFNAWGIGWTLAFGAAGFPMYLASFWIYDRTGEAWVPPFLGGLSGLTAGALWCVQNWVATCYPEESRKGLYVFTNWAIIKSGAVIGSLIVLGININRTESSVAWYLYLVFFLIMCGAAVAALIVAEPSTVHRNDGTAITVFESQPIKGELRSMCLRTRTLDNLLYWLVPIVVTPIFWYLADNKRWTRPTRAYIITIFVLIFHLAGWIGAEVLVSGPEYGNRHETVPGYDWTDAKYGALCVLYIVWGICYATFFQLRLWFIGALSNDPQTLSRYCSLIPAFQAAGIAVAFGIDSTKLPYWKEFSVWFVLFMASFACLYYIVASGSILETKYFLENNVIVPVHVAKQLGVMEGVDEQGHTHQIVLDEEGKGNRAGEKV